MGKTLKNLLSNLMYVSGISALSRNYFSNNGNFILMFHGVSKQKVPLVPKDLQPHLNVNEFEFIIRWLSKRFNFISIKEAIKENKNGILLTFDDGFNNNYTNVYPVLKKYKIPGLFFVSTQHIIDQKNWLGFIQKSNNHKYLKKDLSKENKSEFYDGISKKNLKTMASDHLITIGSHTISHPKLTTLSSKKVSFELEKSKTFLEELTGESIYAFAYPFGNYDKRVISLVKEAGYKFAFGTDVINNHGNDSFEIPRIGIYSHHKAYLSAKLSGLYLKPIKLSTLS